MQESYDDYSLQALIPTLCLVIVNSYQLDPVNILSTAAAKAAVATI